ncbi:conjugal transfer protein TraG N-terminal domain-containing protein [Massilia sp. BJB1822]|uniref:conjugal transfer protein TraG N-terminal domain-containing protein n=1 Tax=Massilia sp. BJB1822 TaxID=2744470 RepID=UPI001594BABF|nr:conjugal transfer protein TraG N-terminal domain-containing protein [Massilia sp. BJB1822]NVD97713.1 conjugal transfer protein TraG N-terminal domain-containing protein [Massilia sp. BJB1822]
MWEIFAYQNSDSLFGILNATAAIAGANTFKGALAIVAFCGFIAAAIAYAFAPQRMQGWQWLASVTLVLSALFIPRVTVGIVDKTGSSAVRIVDNVPFGLAAFGSLTSTVGNSLTELYEMAMQVLPGSANLPSELAYQKNGLLFGNRMIREASTVVFQSPSFRTDLINFINNCTIYDLASGHIPPEEFATSSDVWPMMSTPNPARFTPVTDAVGTQLVAPCTEAYQHLNARMPAQVERIQGLLAVRMNPTLPGIAASAIIAGQVQQAYLRNGIANAAASASDIIRQNAMINAVIDTSLIAGQRINDPASMLLAVGRAQAVAQTNAAWINQGKVAEQALPVIRNTIEAITYAIFPIVILLLLMTSGRETMMGLKNYVSVLIWIQLWPPLYAILNYMAMVYAARDLAAASAVGSGVNALSIMTSSSIYSSAISGEAVVGYLTLSIPLIAWAGLKRMETFGSALIGNTQMLQSTVATATGSAAAGNVSLGNTSMDQVMLAPNRSSAFFTSWQDNASGNTYTSNVESGLTAARALANEGPVSRIVDAKVTEQHVHAASKSVAAAQSESVAAMREKAAALSDVLMSANTHTLGQSQMKGTSSVGSESMGERVNELQQIVKSVSASTGASEQQVASVAFGGSTFVGVKIPGAIAALSPADAGGQVFAKGGKEYSASAQKQDNLIRSTLKSQDRAKFQEFSDTVSRNAGAISSIVSDQRSGHELAARLSETVSRSERAEASLRTQLDFSESVSSAYQRGETFSKDLAKDPRNLKLFEDLLRYEQQGSAAERIKMDWYLGNMATTPNVISRNSNLPNSFGDISGQFEIMGRNVKNREELDKLIVEFRGKVKSKSSLRNENGDAGGGGKGLNGEVTPIRENIKSEVGKVESEFGRNEEEFGKAGVRRDSQNGLIVERSLFGKVNGQIVDDPDVVARKVRKSLDKVDGFFGKKK